MWILPEEQLKRNACVPVSVLGAKNLVTCQSPHVRPSLGTALDCSQWECWNEEGFCAKASCLGESGAVMGVLRDVWGGRDDLAEGWQNCMSGELLFWRQGSFNNLSLSSTVAEWTWNLILARKQIPFFYYRAPALTFSTLMTVLGINSSEFCSKTLTAASFCILSVVMLFAQLIQSDIPVEHPKTCPAWRWGGQMCFLHMFLPTG